MSDHFKTVGDVAAGAVSVLAIFNFLPYFSAFLSALWGLMRLYEGVTGKKFSDSKIAKFLRGEWAS